MDRLRKLVKEASVTHLGPVGNLLETATALETLEVIVRYSFVDKRILDLLATDDLAELRFNFNITFSIIGNDIRCSSI